MTGPAAGAPDPLADALIAARLCAADPGLGGIALRGGGALRDAVIAALRSHLPAGAPLRRVPVHVDDDRLFGGLDLVATLAQGRAVQRAGLDQCPGRRVAALALVRRVERGGCSAGARDGRAALPICRRKVVRSHRAPPAQVPIGLYARPSKSVKLFGRPRSGTDCAMQQNRPVVSQLQVGYAASRR